MTPAPAPEPHDVAPSSWVVRFAPLVGEGGRVLDVACGRGRHATFFAMRGCEVTAVDRDASCLAALAGVANVRCIEADLEAAPWPLPGERFDAVVVTNYLHRALFPTLVAAVADDGVLLYETFARGNEKHGRPTRPEFLLAPDELLAAVRPRLRVVAFEQGLVGGARPAVVQRVAAVAAGRAWPSALPA